MMIVENSFLIHVANQKGGLSNQTYASASVYINLSGGVIEFRKLIKNKKFFMIYIFIAINC